MYKTTKQILSIITVGAAVAALLPQSASATPISGSISFNGNVTPYDDSIGTGTVASDYSMAHSLVFGLTTVSAGANGSFSGVTEGSSVSMYSPLVVNPPGLPVPVTAPLWSTAIGGFTFTLVTLTEDVLVSPFNTMTLRGTGTLSDGNPADTTTGTWVATFTEANSNTGATFSWNSSSQSDITAVTDHGASVMLLGFGLISLGAYGSFRKQNA
jgi:hypothetical protein